MTSETVAGARRQVVLGIATGGLLGAIAFAGADHPPPPGFMLLLLGIAAWCLVVSITRWRLRTRRRLVQLGATAGAGGASCGAIGLFVAALATADKAAALTGQGWIGIVVAVALAAGVGGAMTLASWLLVDRRP